jgi:hypothetical protein
MAVAAPSRRADRDKHRVGPADGLRQDCRRRKPPTARSRRGQARRSAAPAERGKSAWLIPVISWLAPIDADRSRP